MCMAWRFHFPIRNYDFKDNYPRYSYSNFMNWTVQPCFDQEHSHESGAVHEPGDLSVHISHTKQRQTLGASLLSDPIKYNPGLSLLVVSLFD